MGVGRQLREAREARGVTLSALANTTKIAPRQLQLLEREDYQRLPGGIFGRGYVRAVASALGLDAERLVDEFRRHQEPDAAFAPVEPDPPRRLRAAVPADHGEGDGSPRLRLAAEGGPVSTPSHTADRTERQAGGRTHGRALVVLALAVLAVIGVLWLGRAASSGAPGERSLQSPPPAAAAESAGLETPVPQVGTAGAAPSETPRQAPNAVADSQEAGASAQAPLDVTVEAVAPCWVTLQADGRRLAFRMFQAGDTMSATARRHVMVRAGNPAALRLTINGTRTGMGSGGRQQELYITPANYQRLLAAGR
jgi:cytoskeleton protein RodZ